MPVLREAAQRLSEVIPARASARSGQTHNVRAVLAPS